MRDNLSMSTETNYFMLSIDSLLIKLLSNGEE